MFYHKIPFISSMACCICMGASAAEKEPKIIEEGTSTTNVYDSKENIPDQTLPSQFYWNSYPYKTPPANKPYTTPGDGNPHIFNKQDIPGEVPRADSLAPENYWNTDSPENYYDRYWRREEDEVNYKINPSNFNPTFFNRESDQERWDRDREEREQEARERDEERRREDEERRQLEMQRGHSHND